MTEYVSVSPPSRCRIDSTERDLSAEDAEKFEFLRFQMPSADESNSFQLIVIEILNFKCALEWIILFGLD